MYNLEKIFFRIGKRCDVNADEFSVYAHKRKSVDNIHFDLYVIGESHLILSEELDYHEVLVNQKIKNSIFNLSLKEKISVSTKIDHINTSVKILDGNNIELNNVDLEYIFSNNAKTQIKLTNTRKFITVHTLHQYPEFNKVVISETKISI